MERNRCFFAIFVYFCYFSWFFGSIGLQLITILISIDLRVPIDLQNFTPLKSIDLRASGVKMTKIQNFTPLKFFKLVNMI
tara:strand:- start:4949 stop:5188 length:240 start_codon:yes stop_codon:yes gene_type:complete